LVIAAVGGIFVWLDNFLSSIFESRASVGVGPGDFARRLADHEQTPR
jgi:hypothetical protein